MRTGRLVVLTLCALSPLACGQDSTRSIAGPAEELSVSASGIPGRGSLSAFAFGAVRTTQANTSDDYSFTATRDRDGTVQGTFEWTTRYNGETYHGTGRVTCLNVIDNVALMAGVFEQTDAIWIPPTQQYVVWSVQDMGNKKKSPDDLASLMYPSVTAEQAEVYCASSFLPMTPIDEGDVEVWGRNVQSLNANGVDD